ncbi:MAG: Uma2 family endonuclease [Alphaproteobacteria bacterium]
MATGSLPDLRITSRRFFELVGEGLLGSEDRVELLEGVVVAMPPSGPVHASVVHRIQYLLHDRLRGRATVRSQSSLVAGGRSVPEPDVAVLPGAADDWERRHPSSALLVVEVAESSLAQDRLTKSRIYARASIAEYWIVDLRNDSVEVQRSPDPELAVYAERSRLRRGERISPLAFPDLLLDVDDLLPREPLASS